MNFNLSKSSYCNGVQCEKMLWLNKYRKDLKPKKEGNTIDNGNKVGEFAKGLFGKNVDVPYDDNRQKMVEKTRGFLDNNCKIITEESFLYENNFCRVDIFKNDVDGVEIYEVKSSTNIRMNKGKGKLKKHYVDDISYQYYILSNLGFNIKKACLVYINNQYVKGSKDVKEELDSFFNIEDITAHVKDKQDEIAYTISRINEFMSIYGPENEPLSELSPNCFSPYECAYWGYCTRNLPKPNVFDIKAKMHTSTKFKKYNKGKISFEDLQYETDLNSKYLEQIDFELNDKKPKIDKEIIKALLDSLKYPLYFIDYESYNTPIPEVEGTTPFQQLPFQYSLHILKDENTEEYEHKEFLAEYDDPDFVRHFAESMISNLQENGSIIVYNQQFEKSNINDKLAVMFPDLKEEIERINSNIVDFMKPFENRNYYTKEMEGSYSIKYVLPALYPDDPELDYSKLEGVHNGQEAPEAFLRLKNESPEEQIKTRKNLLDYCKLDTWAMVKIYEKFKE